MRASSLPVNVLVLVILFVAGCENRTELAGQYVMINDKKRNTVTVNLELMENGRGSWATEKDNVAFRWEAKRGGIWLHTKSGGVIVGTIEGDTIGVNLPGLGVYRFKKIRE